MVPNKNGLRGIARVFARGDDGNDVRPVEGLHVGCGPDVGFETKEEGITVPYFEPDVGSKGHSGLALGEADGGYGTRSHVSFYVP